MSCFISLNGTFNNVPRRQMMVWWCNEGLDLCGRYLQNRWTLFMGWPASPELWFSFSTTINSYPVKEQKKPKVIDHLNKFAGPDPFCRAARRSEFPRDVVAPESNLVQLHITQGGSNSFVVPLSCRSVYICNWMPPGCLHKGEGCILPYVNKLFDYL